MMKEKKKRISIYNAEITKRSRENRSDEQKARERRRDRYNIAKNFIAKDHFDRAYFNSRTEEYEDELMSLKLLIDQKLEQRD